MFDYNSFILFTNLRFSGNCARDCTPWENHFSFRLLRLAGLPLNRTQETGTENLFRGCDLFSGGARLRSIR